MKHGVFSHTTADYRCTQCGHVKSNVFPNASIFFFSLAVFTSIPTSLIASLGPWRLPWYYFAGAVVGELLLLFLAGIVCSLLFIFIYPEPKCCPNCRASIFLAGRHFAASKKPHRTDFILIVIFLALNVVVWIKVLGNPP